MNEQKVNTGYAGKDKVTIFDYVDGSLPMLQRMFKKREKGYKAMGYQIITSSLHNTANPDTNQY